MTQTPTADCNVVMTSELTAIYDLLKDYLECVDQDTHPTNPVPCDAEALFGPSETVSPTLAPATSNPTPSPSPTAAPTAPTAAPTQAPTAPTAAPTQAPTAPVCGTGTVLMAGVCEAIITGCSEGTVLTAGVCQATIFTCAEGTTYDDVGRRCVPDWGHCYGVRKHWGPGAD